MPLGARIRLMLILDKESHDEVALSRNPTHRTVYGDRLCG